MSGYPHGLSVPDDEGRPYRCGAFISATGEVCILESDHDGKHIFPSETDDKDMDSWRCNGCYCAWHVWKGQSSLTRCPNCKGRDTGLVMSPTEPEAV